MGLDKGMKFCEENKIAAVFITSDKQVYTTSKTGDCTFEFLGEKKDTPMRNKLKFGDFVIIGVVLVMAGALAAALTFHSSGDKLYAEVWQKRYAHRAGTADRRDRPHDQAGWQHHCVSGKNSEKWRTRTVGIRCACAPVHLPMPDRRRSACRTAWCSSWSA